MVFMSEIENQVGVEMRVTPEFERVKMESLVRRGENDEDKVWSSETAGAAAIIDMMGGHAKGIRAGMVEGQLVATSDYRYKEWGSSAGSWVGDKAVNGFARALSKMREELGSEQEAETALRAIAKGVNQVIYNSNEQLTQLLGGRRVDAGGVGVFGKTVMIEGKRCFVGLRNGDVRVGIKKKDGEVKFEKNEGYSVESYGGDGNKLHEFWNRRNSVNTAFQGRDGDVDECKFFALNVEEGDEIILLTDGITDSLEYVDGSDPWQKIKAIWNKAKPGSLLQDLADEARRLESERARAVAEGRTRPNILFVVEGCLPKGYGDDQGGVLIRVGKELGGGDQEITVDNYQQVLMERMREIKIAIQEGGNKVSVEKALASMIADVARAREMGASSEHIDKIMKPVLKLATMIYGS